MAKEQLNTDKLREPSGHFSQATTIEATGKLVFVSGMTARRPDGSIAGIGDVEAQTRQVIENIKSALEEAGGTLDDVCRVDVYIRNMEHFDIIHKVRREYFKPPLPASTMVEITKMQRGVRLESSILSKIRSTAQGELLGPICNYLWHKNSRSKKVARCQKTIS